MGEELNFLAKVEKRLPDLVFTEEQSRLNDLNQDFSSFLGKDFVSWIREFSQKKDKVRILEIGGGVRQVAGRELLNNFNNLHLTAVEKRKIDGETKRYLEGTGCYTLFQNGFSEILDKLKLHEFDIIFLHNVLAHLPNPFLIIEECFKLLTFNGLLFVNGILIYEEEWDKLAEFLKNQGYFFNFTKKPVPSPWLKKGIISISLTLARGNEEDRKVKFPLQEGGYLKDFEGRQLPVKEFFYKSVF